jgi:hypothetical protein
VLPLTVYIIAYVQTYVKHFLQKNKKVLPRPGVIRVGAVREGVLNGEKEKERRPDEENTFTELALSAYHSPGYLSRGYWTCRKSFALVL